MTHPHVSPLRPRPLFGGAIIMDLPENYGDASDLRQIPDNQEVFLSPNSDTSLVLEILAMVEDGAASTDLWEATKFHFDSIAHDNSALSSTILTSTPPAPLSSHPRPSHPQSQSQSHSQLQSTPASSATSPNLHLITPSPVILTGLQHVHKFSHNPSGAPRPGHESDTPDTVWIGVALWRVWTDPPDTTAPNTGAPSESGPSGAAPSGGGSGRGGKKADVVCSINVNLSSEDGQGSIERGVVERWWSRSVQSLVIRDWDLFGDAE